MDINTVCTLLINALKDTGYNDSTIFNYQGAVRRFKTFCKEHDVTEYNYEIGKLYADAVISPKTGKFSKERYHLQGRFIRLIDSYINTGQFDFSATSRSRVQPKGEYYRKVYSDYCSYLEDEYENENTRHFYEYGMYAFLSFLEEKEMVVPLENLTATMFLDYVKHSKPERQRGILCEIRKICRYLDRNDLLVALSGIHAPRHHRIIPVLEGEEQERIKSVTDDDASFDGVICNLSGMSTLEQVRDNINSVQNLEPLSTDEMVQLHEVVKLYKNAGPIGADLEKYRGLIYHGAPVTAILEAYNMCQLQPDPGFADDNNYLKNTVAEEAHLDFFGELPEEKAILADGTDVTETVKKAECWLIEHSF